jgi:hypothetical protein
VPPAANLTLGGHVVSEAAAKPKKKKSNGNAIVAVQGLRMRINSAPE